MIEPVSLVVLCGGRNTRMHGLNKGLLRLRGESFLDRLHRTAKPLVVQSFLVSRQAANYGQSGFIPVGDRYSVRSSLTGVHAGLAASTTDWNLILPCDLPLVKRALLALLIAQASESRDAVVPRCGGHYEPLCAAYSRRCLPAVEALLETNRPKISNLFDLVRVTTLEEGTMRQVDPELESFMNINTVEDLTRLEERLGAKGRGTVERATEP